MKVVNSTIVEMYPCQFWRVKVYGYDGKRKSISLCEQNTQWGMTPEHCRALSRALWLAADTAEEKKRG